MRQMAFESKGISKGEVETEGAHLSQIPADTWWLKGTSSLERI
jgi:hypothetical protein